MVFWVIMPYSVVIEYQHLGGLFYLHLQAYAEDGSTTFQKTTVSEFTFSDHQVPQGDLTPHIAITVDRNLRRIPEKEGGGVC